MMATVPPSAAEMTHPREALVVESLHKSFGLLEVIKGISLLIHQPTPAAVSPAWRSWSVTLRRKFSSVLVLVVLLAGAATAVHAASDPEVEAIQRALSERGFDPGKIDGAMGWRTRDAIRGFQRSFGLPDTGRADTATLEALGLVPPARKDASMEAETPQTGTPGTEAEPGPDRESPKTETPRAGPAPVPDDRVAPKADQPSPRPATKPLTDTPEPDARPAQPAPKPVAKPKPDAKPQPAEKPKLSFAALGWHRPQTGGEALERFIALGGHPDFKRGAGSLFVPNPELVFVLKAGERIPGLDCDPGAGRLSIEFVFGPDGPVIFTPDSGGAYCRMGIGIAIAVGRTLELRRVDWGARQYPHGTVRVTNEGLEYVR